MATDQLTYFVFGGVLILALIFDLGLLSKKGQKVTIKKALYQTFFWVALALGFLVFLWSEQGQTIGLEYLSAYLMEWSLSIDNIFVFILIFTSFRIKEKYYGQVLLLGILMAILFRVIFITAGVALVHRFEEVLYVFGAFLIYTGYKMFSASGEEEFHPKDSKIYKFIRRIIPLVPHDGDGKFTVVENGKKYYTILFVVVVMLAFVDIAFAVDSIPAVMGISKDKLVIYTSNIFAVLGLRSLFFLLRGAVSKFDYLPQGIAIVLIFIGAKMLGEKWINEWLDKSTQVFISLGVIMLCLSGSIFYSIFMKKKGTPKDIEEGEVY